MSEKQYINTGSIPNDGTGDPLRTAFTKVNSNLNQTVTKLQEEDLYIDSSGSASSSGSIKSIVIGSILPVKEFTLNVSDSIEDGGNRPFSNTTLNILPEYVSFQVINTAVDSLIDINTPNGDGNIKIGKRAPVSGNQSYINVNNNYIGVGAQSFNGTAQLHVRPHSSNTGSLFTVDQSNSTNALNIDLTGSIKLNNVLELAAGSTSRPPFRFRNGALLSAASIATGSLEYRINKLYIIITSGSPGSASRKELAIMESTNSGSDRIFMSSPEGRLVSSDNFRYILSSNTFAGSGILIRPSALPSTRAIFIGDLVSFAGQESSSGVLNIGIGPDALNNIGSGSRNVALGESAGSAITSGSWNVMIGSQAASNNINSNWDVIIGSLANFASGNFHTILGGNALRPFNNTHTGSQWTVIGYGAGLPSGSGNGKLSIQNAIYGLNNVATGSLPSSGGIGIYVQEPTARLHLPSGSTSASMAPLKFISGSLLTVPEDGAVEFGGDLYITSGSTRYVLAKRERDIPFVTPEQYGAVGDGSTDDQAAIQAALNTGLPVKLAAKNYRIGSTLTFLDGYSLFGGGNGSIISATANIHLITITGFGCTLSDFQLLGNSAGAQRGISVTGNAGLTLNYTQNRLHNLKIRNMAGNGIYVTLVVGVTGTTHSGALWASNCIVESCGTGYNLDTRGEYCHFSNCVSFGNTTGLRIAGGNVTWTGGKIVDGTTGVSIQTGTNDGHATISSAMINHNTTNILTAGVINGYLFIGCQVHAGNVTVGTSDGIRFVGCDFNVNTFTYTNSTNSELVDCKFVITSTFTITGTPPILVNPKWMVTPSPTLAQTIPGIQILSLQNQFTKSADTTLQNINNLSASVAAGKKYQFEASLFTNSDIAGGVKFAVSGTCTSTATIYDALVTDSASFSKTRSLTLGGLVGNITAVTASFCQINGFITVLSSGSLALQFAQNANTGSSSILTGSNFIVREVI